ncbi:family transcriptional regulator [Trichoderma arundinaceum]|uniref:Family transcriptional regulator n=1 Tax=Trichoderma arundinaceum TaxID=490622 RepID=A0A395NYW4_TRIAR|nr:family transcriptional regulator [Trichoderma arundinaceum]
MIYDFQSLSPTPLSPSFENDDSRWQAVQDRDIRADGCFVTAAQSAGFRACKRCRPEVDGFHPEEPAVQKIREFLQKWERAAISNEGPCQLSLSQMAREAKVSKWYFHRMFKKYVGVTPVQYLRTWRKTMQLQHQLDNNGLNWLDQLAPGAADWPQLTDMFADSKVSALDNFFKDPGENSPIFGADFSFSSWQG